MSFTAWACSMTSGAQQALRRTMEIYSNTTRFALACNTSSKIIEPIQSRCAIVRYTKLGEKDLLERLLFVCQQEKVREGSGRGPRVRLLGVEMATKNIFWILKMMEMDEPMLIF